MVSRSVLPVWLTLAASCSGVASGPPVLDASPVDAVDAHSSFVDAGDSSATTSDAHFDTRRADSTTPDASRADVPVTPTAPRNQLGLNIGYPVDYDQTRLYADLIKTSRDPRDLDNTRDVAVDANGWPMEADFQVFAFALDQMNGTFDLSFAGRATNVIAPYGGTVSTLAYDSASNTSSASVVFPDATTQNFALNFVGTTRSAGGSPGLTNIRLMRPLTPGSSTAYPRESLFTNEIKTLSQRFSVIRFMQFLGTNSNQQRHWSERTRPTTMSFNRLAGQSGYGFEGRGGPWEDVVRFANAVRRDAWITLPLHADFDYVRRVAQLFAYGSDGVNPYTSPQTDPVYPPLAADLNLYVESSNETWNFAFTQAHDVDDLAAAEPPAPPINYDGMTGSGAPHARYTAMRAAQISLIFRQVFGDEAMMTRIRPVLTSQSVWPLGPGGISAMLRFMHAYFNNGEGDAPHVPNASWVVPGTSTQVGAHPANYYFYGGGGAAYYTPSSWSSLSDVLTSGNMNPDSWITAPDGYQQDLHTPAVFGIRRIAYEGGPSLDGHGMDPIVVGAINSARPASPNITDVMQTMHDRWSEHGGELLVYFTAAHDAQWGFARVSATHPGGNIFDIDTPKVTASTELAARAPAALTYGAAIPGALPGAAFETTQVGWEPAAPAATGSKTLNPSNSWAAYIFRGASTSARRLEVTLSANSGMLAVYLDGRLVGVQASVSGVNVFDTGEFSTALHGVIVRIVGGAATVERVALN